MKKKATNIFRSVMAILMSLVVALGVVPPFEIMAASGYTVHTATDLKNTDALYHDYVEDNDLQFAYITNLKSPSITINNTAFSVRSANGMRAICIPAKNNLPKATGRTNAKLWSNVATIKYSNAGYYGDSTSNTFDIVFTLDKVVAMKHDRYNLNSIQNDYPYYAVASVPQDGSIMASAYLRNANLEAEAGPYTAEIWSVKLLDKSGKQLKNTLLVQTYKDLDIYQTSNDTSYEKSFSEGFSFTEGFVNDIYVRDNTELDISAGVNNIPNSTFKAPTDSEDSDAEYQPRWVVAAIANGSAEFRWSGMKCASWISNAVSKTYPDPPNPVKKVDKPIVEANEEVTWTVDMEFPVVNPSNCAKSIRVEDTFDDLLTIEQSKIKVLNKNNEDKTSEWTINVDGQKVTLTAKNPGSITGKYTFKYPTLVKDTVLDGKELVVKNGKTYARIPNIGYVFITDQFNEEYKLPTPPVETLTPGASISLVKDVDRAHIQTPTTADQLKYTFTIKNTGKLTLHDITLTDSKPVQNLTIDWNNSSDPDTGAKVLSPGETVTGTADYTLTEDDITAELVHNVADVTGKDPQNGVVTDEDDADTTMKALAAITLTKTADPQKMTDPDVGDLISYRFTIENTGNVTLENLVFSDDHELVSLKWDVNDLASAQLAVGDKISGTASYKLTQADIDAGDVLNKAHIDAVGTNKQKVSDDAEAETVITTTPAIQLIKTTPNAIIQNAKKGTKVPWNFEIKNTGKNTLHDVHIVDHLKGISSITYKWSESSNPNTGDGVLAPGETVPASATYALKAADIIAGEVINTATAHGTDPYGTEVTSNSEAGVKIPEQPSITLTKTAQETQIEEAKVGDIIHYDFSFTNNGNCALDNVAITDELEGISELTYTWPGEPNHLEVGETATATATYALKQEDIDHKDVYNDATVSGVSPRGTWVSAPANADTVIITNPAITLDKDVDLTEIKNALPGMTVNYTVTVTNTGGNTLHDIELEDTLGDLYDVTIEPEVTTMAPGDSFVMHAKYDITQADINNGKVPNTASVTAKDPEDTVVKDEDTVETILEQTAKDSVKKEVSVQKVSANDAKPGFELVYTFTAKNEGNTTLHDVEFTDEMLTNAGVEINWEWKEKGILQPQEVLKGTATYKLTQDDIDAGKVLNTVIMNAKDPSDTPLEPQEDTVTTEIEQAPAMAVKKMVDKTSVKDAKAGDPLQYTFEASNTGNVRLDNVVFTDEMLDAAKVEIKWDWSTAKNGEGTLLPGEVITGKADVYPVTQADIDAGKVINKVVMNANDPNGDPVDPVESEVQTVLEQTPAHVVTKDVDKKEIKEAKVGDILTYTFTYTNTGNTTLTDIEFTDEKLANAGVEITWDWSKTEYKGEEATMLPGEVITGSATYAITQADIDAKHVRNTILATAKNPGGKDPDPSEDIIETEIENTPLILIDKTADKAKIENAKVGDKINYTFKVKNAGNVTLSNIQIEDKLEGISKPEFNWKESTDEATDEGVLSPGEEVTATAVYAITQADINAGKVHNTALATGETPDGKKPESPESEVETELVGTPGITITKTVDKTSLTNPAVGTILTYTFTITNTGSVTLKDISITDSLTGKGLSAITYKYPDKSKTLDPGVSMTATATYAITQADITAKKVDNTAIATGKTPDGKNVKSNESKVTTVINISTTPSNPSNPTTTTTTTTASSVKTGDISYIALFAVLGLVVIIGVVAFRKRKA